ncbi:sugar-transfer associated ATP-grasp domain-containing protein [Xylanibacter ruminicola]|uniref:sugar-transfer associated ATP-grasp domain-containing protein n=1 Tax=Xylanibacter ruminicola TaxID=839 RepID=UPI0021565686|nr:sugar-transfer associated ATP-grasp domain-containing protein [Xylanibacter ruminicola]
MNKRCTALSAFLRMGSKGSFVDNFCSGVGVLVGINNEGYLNEYGVDKNFDKVYKAPSGLEFKGMKIPNYNGIKQQIIGFHKKILMRI